MRLHLFEYTCGQCRHRFTAPVLVGGYGVLLLRSTGRGAEAVVDTFHDPVFDEVSGMLRNAPGVSDLSSDRRRELTQAVFSVACDPDIDGTPYVVGARPRCPNCGSRTISYWQATEPPQIVDVDVPHVTHERWSRMSGEERTAAVERAAADFLA